MNSVGYFEIQSDDLEKCIEFYTKVFGWIFTKQEGMLIEYYQIKTDGINGGLLKRPAKIPPMECGTNAYTCSIEVDNFDVISEKIIKSGGQIALPKFAVLGKCWQGYFLDLDHNTFGIFQVDPQAK